MNFRSVQSPVSWEGAPASMWSLWFLHSFRLPRDCRVLTLKRANRFQPLAASSVTVLSIQPQKKNIAPVKQYPEEWCLEKTLGLFLKFGFKYMQNVVLYVFYAVIQTY